MNEQSIKHIRLSLQSTDCVSFPTDVSYIELVNYSSFVTGLDYSLKDCDNDGFINASSLLAFLNA